MDTIGDFSWLGVVIFSCGVNTAVTVICFRLYSSGGMFRALLAGFLAGCAALLAASWVFHGQSVWGHLSNVVVYICFSYVFFHWNNMGETGRRVRLAIELRNAPDGLTRAELVARYGHREIVDRRLGRLIESRQIEEIGSRYHVRNLSVLAMARIIALLKLVLKVE
jgi:hypothetical protein